MTIRFTLAALALVLPALAAAQTPAVATDFPATAEPLANEALKARMAGRVFRLQYANGTKVRLDIRANGYMYADLSNGVRGTGKWHVEGSAWCDAWQQGTGEPGCNEIRLADGVLLLKRRSNGEVVAMRE